MAFVQDPNLNNFRGTGDYHVDGGGDGKFHRLANIAEKQLKESRGEMKALKEAIIDSKVAGQNALGKPFCHPTQTNQ